MLAYITLELTEVLRKIIDVGLWELMSVLIYKHRVAVMICIVIICTVVIFGHLQCIIVYKTMIGLGKKHRNYNSLF